MKTSNPKKQMLLDVLNLSGLRRTTDKTGLPPGSLVYVGEQKVEKTVISIVDYVTAQFLKDEFDLISDDTLIYFRDVNDHAIQIMEAVDVYREVLSSMIDTYVSTLSLRMNEVMKVLTIAAAIFMPLTFIAGIYGMNFKYMPELEWKLGYFTVWGVMIALIIVMVLYFRRKRWL